MGKAVHRVFDHVYSTGNVPCTVAPDLDHSLTATTTTN